MPGQPRFGVLQGPLAELAAPVVELGGQLVRQRRGVLRRPLRPRHAVSLPGELQALEAVVQDAGDRPGAIHRGGGDPLDDLADVVPGELGIPELVLQDLPRVLPLVPPGFGFGKPGCDLLVDVRVQGLPGGRGPQVEEVAGSPGPFLGLPDLLGGGQVFRLALHDAGEHGFGGGLLVGLPPGRGGLASDHVRGVGFPASGHADVQSLPGQGVRDEEVGGVDGAALGDVDVAAVAELGVVREVRPGDPERFGPRPVRPLPPHLRVRPAQGGDLQRVPVGEFPPGGVDVGVEAGPDQVADTGPVPVGQGSLRRRHRAELDEPGLHAPG
jgi:hypothetical protein